MSLVESCAVTSNTNGNGSVLLSLESHKAVPAPFLTKTYQLVDDPSTDHIVSWGDDHSTFVVWRPPEFARDLLPNYFKHNNFSSFVRQLNTYGFRKIVPERWEFANEFFRKGEKHLLCEIHRRKTCSSSSSTSPPPHHPLHLPFQSYHHNYSHHHHPLSSTNTPAYLNNFPTSDEVLTNWRETSYFTATGNLSNGYNAVPAGVGSGSSVNASASALMEDNQRLRRSNAVLLSELAHMRKLYNDIIYFVQNHVRPVAPSSDYPSSLLVTNSAEGSGRNVGVQRPTGVLYQKQNGVGCLNSGSTTSSSSLTIVEEPPPLPKNNNHGAKNENSNNNSSSSGEEDEECGAKSRGSTSTHTTTKLFGVSLGLSGNKRPPLDEEAGSPAASPSTKPRFVLRNEDLGFNLMSKSSSS